MAYGIAPRDYLARAAVCLNEGSERSLFYAAYELRCCVEARQAGYISELEMYSDVKVKPWQVRENFHKLKVPWPDAHIIEIKFEFEDGWYPLYFTPVSEDLIKSVEVDLGRLLHSQRSEDLRKQDWLEHTRQTLEKVYSLAWFACRGEIVAPPLMDYQTGRLHPIAFYESRRMRSLIENIYRAIDAGTLQFSVDYPDEPPSRWNAELRKQRAIWKTGSTG